MTDEPKSLKNALGQSVPLSDGLGELKTNGRNSFFKIICELSEGTDPLVCKYTYHDMLACWQIAIETVGYEWKRVIDSMPDSDGYYVVAIKGEEGWRYSHYFKHSGFHHDNVTHWLNVPCLDA